MAKIVKSEVLGPEHPIYGGECTISSHRKRTPEQEVSMLSLSRRICQSDCHLAYAWG